MTTQLKTDIVGSFLPPENLTAAKNQLAVGAISSAEYQQIEDSAVRDIVDRQLAAGLGTVTSGEIRRQYWDKDFYFGLGGIRREKVESGHIYQDWDCFTDNICFTGRIAFNPEHPFLADFKFLADYVASRANCRQTLPSPADLYLEILAMTEGFLGRVYPDADNLLGDIAEAYRQTILAFYDLGCRDIQIDDTACARLSERGTIKSLLQGGVDLMKLQDEMLGLYNAIAEELPTDLALSVYISGGSRVVPEWNMDNSAENFLVKVLGKTKFTRFFLPFDTEHPEQTSVLRFLPAQTSVTLGLVNAHSPFLDDEKIIAGMVDKAATYFNRNRLSVSPTSGFKLSEFAHRGLTYADQWRKIESLTHLVL